MVQRYGGFATYTIAISWHSAYQILGNRLYRVTFTPKVNVRDEG